MFTARAKTGIDLLDQSWEGLSRAAAYLFYGPAPTGRILLVLQVVRAGADAAEKTILVSGKEPQELASQSRSIDFDLEGAARQGHVRLLRLPDSLLSGGTDETIEKGLRDLAGLIRREQPARVVIEDFTPFVRFSRFEKLQPALEKFFQDVAAVGSTLVLALGEPANARSEQIVSFLRTLTEGSIHLAMDSNVPAGTARRLTLQPTLGSGSHEREFAWDLAHLKNPKPHTPDVGFPVSNGDGQVDTLEGEPNIEVRPTPPEIMPPPSADAPPADIRFFDPKNPLGPAPHVRDPFGETDDDDSTFERAHYVEGSHVHPPAPRSSGAAPEPVSEPQAESLPPSFTPDPPAPPEPIMEEPPQFVPIVEPEKTDRELFAEVFDQSLSDFRGTQAPFLALALRLPSDAPSEAVAVLERLLRATIDSAVTLYADQSSMRLAILLPNRGKEASAELFGTMKQHLQISHPQIASTVLPKLAAVVVPNGHPFETGSAFLEYVFDSPSA